MAGVEGLDARPDLVVMAVVVWIPCIASPMASASSRSILLSFRLPTTRPPLTSGSSLFASSSRCSLECVPVSFMVVLTSNMLRPVTPATGLRSGVLAPFALCETEDGLIGSTIELVEFCLARDEAGRPPFVGAGDTRPVNFDSGNVVRIGEDAIEGDMATDVTVLFLIGTKLASNLNKRQ